MSVNTKTIDGITISVAQSMPAFEAVWRNLQDVAPQLPFLSFDWCSAWLAQNANDFGISPLIVMGTDGQGKAVFILPLQKRRSAGLTVVEWLGQQGNLSCSGIFAASFAGAGWFAQHFADVLKLIAPIDVVNLRNMPGTFNGSSSLLAALHVAEAANASFATDLQPNYELLLREKRSARSISKMRRRDLRLEESGSLQMQVLQGEAAIDAAVESLHHKNEQLKQAGVGDIFTEKDENLYKHILSNAPNLMQVFRLQLNGETMATMIGAKSGSIFWLLISALAPAANLQFSPGDYLLRRTIAHCCATGITSFDFCLGEQDYKQLWADQRIPNYNYIKAQNLKGLPLALTLQSAETIKRIVKKNTVARNAYYSLRKRLRGVKAKP